MDIKMMLATLPDDQNLAWWCRRLRVSRQTAYKWRARYARFGVAGLEERSRAARQPAGRTSDVVEDEIVRLRKALEDGGLDAGAETIRWHLEQAAGSAPTASTIWRVLARRGLIVPEPAKAPKGTCQRFERDRPNECWQIDATHWRLAAEIPVEIINQIDDRSRLNVDSFAVSTCTSEFAVAAFNRAAQRYGLPREVLSDNGSAFTTRDTATAVAFEAHLHTLDIDTIHSRAYHPQTCGKIERFHQTQKRWLQRQPATATIGELQVLLDTFRALYNQQRPHRSLARQTPQHVWDNEPKAGPVRHARAPETTFTDRLVNSNGTLPLAAKLIIGIGAAYRNAPVTVIRTGDRLTITHRETGHTLRDFTIDPTRTYQPQHP